MKPPLTRRPPQDTGHEAEPTEPGEWSEDEGPAAVGGWSTGARANTTALLRYAAWGLLIAGPLLGLAAFVSLPASAGTAPKAASTAPAATGSQGAAGFAQLFVAAYIGAGEGDQDKLAAYYPAASGLRLEGASGRRSPEQLTVVRLRQTDQSVWSVTVATRITEATTGATASPTGGRTGGQADSEKDEAADAVRYFQVPVATGSVTGGATGYVALAMPAEVAAPERIQTPELIYGPMRAALPSDPRTQAVTEFLTAYLTGAGDLDRYLAPGTTLTAVTPPPYTGIAVDQLAIEGEQASEAVTAVPGDGTKLRLLVALRATGTDQVRVPLTYALTLSARAGRWEIAALDGAPTPASVRSATPTSSASPTP